MNTDPSTRQLSVQTTSDSWRMSDRRRQLLASGRRALWLAFAMGLSLQTAAGAATDTVNFAIADPSFSTVLALETRVPNPDVRRLIVQPDGKIVVAGGMRVTANPRQAALLRLNSDGTIDEAFAPAIEFDEGGKPGLASVDLVVLQPDRGLVVGGRFTSVNGVARPGLARVRSDGSHDDTFDPGVGSGMTLALQADGRILVGGAFNNFRGEPRRPLVRLEQNGAYDRTFVAALPGDSYVSAVAVQQDGNILVSVTSNSSAVGKGVIRLKPDGSQDGSFDTGLGIVNRFKAGSVSTIHPLPDGRVYVAGTFTAVNGQPRRGLARLLSNGNADPSFVPQGIPVDQEGTAWVTALAVQADGKPLISWYPVSYPAVLLRLMPDGTPDANFLALNGLVPCPDCLGSIWTLTLQPDGRILAGGPRGSLTPDGIPRTGVVRLLPSGGTGFDLWQGDVKTSETIGEVAVTVRRRGDTSGTGSVRFFTRDRSARAGEDYVAQEGQLTFAPGETSKTVRLRVLDDPLVEALENFELLLDQPEGGILVGQTTVTVTLLSEDDHDATVAFEADRYDAHELRDASITVVRSGSAQGSFSVSYETGPGRATPGADFQPVKGSLWLSAGQMTSTIMVPIFEDAIPEDPESFSIRLSNPVGQGAFRVGLGNPSQALVMIQDAGTVIEFANSEYHTSETNRLATISVRRRGETNSALSVGYFTRAGTAQAGRDYVAQSGTLTFAAGQTTSEFIVPVLDGSAVDGTRRLELQLTDPTGGAVLVLGTATATLQILDDERPVAFDPSFDSPLRDGSSLRALVGLPDGRLVIGGELLVDGSATPKKLLRLSPDGAVDPAFHQGVSGSQGFEHVAALALGLDGKVLVLGRREEILLPEPLDLHRLLDDGTLDPAFRSGLASRKVPYLENARIVVQPDGRILVLGSSLAGGLGDWPGIVRLNPDGSPDDSFDPGSGATFVYPHSPERRYTGIRAAAVQPDGGILIGGQFTRYRDGSRAGLARLLPDGLLDPDFPQTGFGINADQRPPPDAHLRALALRPDGGILVGGSFDWVDGVRRSRLAWLLEDGGFDKFADPGVQWFGNGVEVMVAQPDGGILIGGCGGTGNGSAGLARVTAEGGLDPRLVTALGCVRFITVQPGGNLIVGGDFTEDEDVPQRYLARVFGDTTARRAVEFEARSYRVEEDRSHVMVTVVRAGDSGAPLSVDYATHDDSAVGGFDFSRVSGTLTFAPGEHTKELRIPLLDDGRVEGHEIFRVILSAPSAGVLLGAKATTHVVITDNEASVAIDTGFDAAVDRPVLTMVRQPDGKIILGGSFTRVNGIPRNGLARLHPDGSLDASFQASLGPTNECCPEVRALTLQPDGRVIVGGSFIGWNTSVKGSREDLVRLEANGDWDPTFGSPPSEALPVRALAIDSVGRILVRTDSDLVRLTPDGQRDAGFKVQPGLEGHVDEIAVRPDGRLLVIGGFYDSIEHVTRPARRLEADGSDDPTYRAATSDPASGWVFGRALAIQSDGRVIVTGSDGTEAILARLDETGAVDPSFRWSGDPAPDAWRFRWIQAVGVAGDGTMLILGGGSSPHTSVEESRVYQWRPDGSLDPLPLATGPINGALKGSFREILTIGPGRFLTVSDITVRLDKPGRFTLFRTGDAIPRSSFEFTQRVFHASEAEGGTTVTVRRLGDVSGSSSVRVTTRDGSAIANRDYVPVGETLNFRPLEAVASVEVRLRDNPDANPDRTLELQLGEPGDGAALGRARTTLIIHDDDTEGSLDFAVKSAFPENPAFGVGPTLVGTIRVLPGGGFRVWGQVSSPTPGNFADPYDLAAFAEYDVNGAPVPVAVTPPPVLAYRSDGHGYTHVGHQFVRVRPDGTVDPSFKVLISPALSVLAVASLPDGRVMIGGSFDTVNGEPRRGLARLLPDGSLDPAFRDGVGLVDERGTTSEVIIRSLAVQRNGRILVGGQFAWVHMAPRPSLARLEADGAVDSSFGIDLAGAIAGANIQAVAAEPAGSVLALGYFPSFDPGYWLAVRFSSEGAVRGVVASGLETLSGEPWCPNCPGGLEALAVLPGGDILLGGRFASFREVPLAGLVRLRGKPLPRPILESPRLGPDGVFTGRISGQSGWTYRLEASTDLLDWTQVHEMTSQGVQTGFSVPLADSSTYRFFRIVAK